MTARFCDYCGTELHEYDAPNGYHPNTGQAVMRHWYRCPKRGRWFGWNGYHAYYSASLDLPLASE